MLIHHCTVYHTKNSKVLWKTEYLALNHAGDMENSTRLLELFYFFYIITLLLDAVKPFSHIIHTHILFNSNKKKLLNDKHKKCSLHDN